MSLKFRWRLSTLMAAVVLVGVILWSRLPAWRQGYAEWAANRVIYRQLDRIVPLRHPKGIPLERLFAQIQAATVTEDFPSGLVIYTDSEGLQDVGQSVASPVAIDVQDRPLGESLRAALDPLGLDYRVQGGFLTVSDQASLKP